VFGAAREREMKEDRMTTDNPEGPKGPAKTRNPRGAALNVEQLASIHSGIANAGLGHLRIASMHLVPATADDPGDPCHSEQLPNGQWIIVC
jgi:hypothetical protein